MQIQENKRYADRHHYWHELIKKYEESGLGPAEFCRQENVSHSSFSNWHNRFLKSKNINGKQTLIPVKIKDDNVPNKSGIFLFIKNDIRICIESNTDKAALKILFETLGILPC